MYNHVTLVGRLTKDLELRKTQQNLSVCNFTLACRTSSKEDDTEFIDCVAWRNSADFLCHYAQKGDLILAEGSLKRRSYDGINGKVYVTEVICSEVKILAKKQNKDSSVTEDDLSIVNDEDNNSDDELVSNSERRYF